jgi:hypothetical protein
MPRAIVFKCKGTNSQAPWGQFTKLNSPRTRQRVSGWCYHSVSESFCRESLLDYSLFETAPDNQALAACEMTSTASRLPCATPFSKLLSTFPIWLMM